MKKLFMFLILGIFLISLASAGNIGTFKIDEPFQITNYCNSGDCTYMNLTSIAYPNGTILYINEEMTKNGQEFNYSFTSGIDGEYNFKTCANPNSDLTCESDTFILTKTGVFAIDLSDTTNLIVMIILFLLSIGAFLLKRQEISSLIMFILGFFMLLNGINTIASVVVIALGVIIAFIGGDD